MANYLWHSRLFGPAYMKRTGEDISHVSKETSLGGLAAILGEC